jgi:protease-4
MEAPKPQDLTQAMAEALIGDLLRERRTERRWRWGFRVLFIGGSIVVSLLYFLLWAPQFGWRIGPIGDVVGVVRIDGEISQGSLASAGRVVPALKKAVESPQVKAVVLAIDSPGGSPGESERIYRAMKGLKAENPKPVIAVVGNVGASAAYLIALHADKVYAGQYSLVGSVGAVLAGWDLHRAAERLDVSQRLYASGPLKAMLSPFQPLTEVADVKARALIREIGEVFVEEVKRRRGDKLSATADVASGEIWLGPDAKRLGLIDEIGTLEDVIRGSWNLNWYDFGPRRQNGLFVAETRSDLISEIVERVISHVRFQIR